VFLVCPVQSDEGSERGLGGRGWGWDWGWIHDGVEG
jgi:hypothetical protein